MIKGSEVQKQMPHELLWMLWFDKKSKSTVSSSHSSSTAMKWKKSLSVTIYESNNSDMKQDCWDLLFHSNFFVVNFLGFAPLIFKCPVVSETSTIILHIFFSYFSFGSSRLCGFLHFKENSFPQILVICNIKAISHYLTKKYVCVYISITEMSIYHNAFNIGGFWWAG